ncbi:hypothetical protein C1645_836246 [Glomus cerebriforme]|uniref:Uncharacterized protein n=1 Tax=Glomus cerebriforme TaxID=658196 RepID=A0A397SHD6_9GLOM|nr:hypothetical protein C1645_836246 [Glomus cerebriforme]
MSKVNNGKFMGIIMANVKLHYSIKAIARTLSIVDPEMFYKNRNGKIFQEESNTPIIISTPN